MSYIAQYICICLSSTESIWVVVSMKYIQLWIALVLPQIICIIFHQNWIRVEIVKTYRWLNFHILEVKVVSHWHRKLKYWNPVHMCQTTFVQTRVRGKFFLCLNIMPWRCMRNESKVVHAVNVSTNWMWVGVVIFTLWPLHFRAVCVW
jgi:hypothetical protein